MQKAVEADCSVKIDGDVIDLGRLKHAGSGPNGSYLVQARDYDYLLDVCAPVQGGCGDDSGGCQIQ